MHRLVILSSLLMLFLGFSVLGSDCHATTDLEKRLFCEDTYEEFRKIRYWGAVRMDLYDMELSSNDTNVLKLHDGTGDKTYFIPNKTIMDHYMKEFDRLLKGNIPFHNTDQGASERLGEVLRRAKKENKTIEQSMTEYNSVEDARRKALYGDNPGLLQCRIRIKRHEYPVLFEMKIHISADKYLRHNQPSLLVVEDVGYSTPENIEAEIKKAITAQLQLLSEKFGYVRKCSN